MDRNGALRKAAVSGFSGLQKRRSVRDSSKEMELKDRDQSKTNRNDRDRDLIRKRRRVGESSRRNDSEYDDDESSDEEEEEKMESLNIHHKNNRINTDNNNQSLSNRSNNRRSSLRTLRSSPVFRTAVDDLFTAPIPRKARSVSTKRLNDQFKRRRFSSTSPPSSSGGSSMRKKMKSVEPRVRNNSDSGIQDDIEFEVAEALFDLMKQSQSQSPKNNDSNRVKANSVQNEETIEVVDQIEEMNGKESNEKEILCDDKGEEELLGSDMLLSKGKVKVNACRFQDQTMTKLDCGSVSVGTSKETNTALMGPPLKLCATSGKEVSVDAASKSMVTTSLAVMERPESSLKQQEKIDTARSSQVANLDLEKDAHDVSARDGSKQQPWGLNGQKSQPSNSFLSFPIPMNGWQGGLPHPGPHPGYMAPLQALPVDGNGRSTIPYKTPQFKFSQPRSRRSTTHQLIALSIQSHAQLFKNSMSTGFTGGSNSYSSKQTNLNLESTALNAPENLLLGGHNGGLSNKSSEVSKAMRTSMPMLASQQATDQFPAAKFFGPALILPFGQNQSASAVNDASLNSNPALNLPVMTFNQQNMATFQKNSSQFPIPPNIALQKNGLQVPALPFFNSSFYSTPVFDASQNQQHSSLPHASLVQTTSQNTTSSGSSSRRPPRGQQQTGPSDNAPDTMKNSLIPSNGQLFSVPIQPMNRDSQQKGYQPFALSFGSSSSTNASHNFQMLPDMPRDGYQKFFQAPESKSTIGSVNLENGLKGVFEKIPESNGSQSHNFTSSGSSADGLGRNMYLVTSSSPGNSVTIPNFNQNHQQLVQLQNQHMQLNGVKDPIFSSLQWDNFPQQLKNAQGQAHISFGNMPLSPASFQGRNVESQLAASLPNNVAGNLINSPASSASSSHQVDVSQNGAGQKSSPACRRNVPSILGTCGSQQPSELKY